MGYIAISSTIIFASTFTSTRLLSAWVLHWSLEPRPAYTLRFGLDLSVPLKHLPMRQGAIYFAASGRCSEHWCPAACTTLPKEQSKKESIKGDTYSLDEMRYSSEQR